jgi:hypothetical protein
MCKALKPCATELFFESYDLLLRKEGGAYVQSRSIQLLREKPDLAKLVRRVWIALAAATPQWLRERAAFSYYTVPSEDTALELAYMTTSMHSYGKEKEDEDEEDYWYMGDYINEDRKAKDFTQKQYQTIREYYANYVAPPAYANQYEGPISVWTLEVLLAKHLRIFSRHLSIVSASGFGATMASKNGLSNSLSPRRATGGNAAIRSHGNHYSCLH